MTIKELHVGIDLGVQRLDSNIFGNIQSPEKDYYINIVIDELLRAIALNEKNTVFSILTYADIMGFYEATQAYIIRAALPLEEMLGHGYVRCELPENNTSGIIDNGNLVNGTTYEVAKVGATNLTRFGYPSNPTNAIGDVFKCTIADYKHSNIITLPGNGLYKIVNTGGYDFVLNFNATSNDVGTIFRDASLTAPDIQNDSVHLEVIEENPGWDSNNITQLKVLSTDGYYLYIKSDSYTEYGNLISSGSLHKGLRYKIINPGIPPAGGGVPNTNLEDFGGYKNNDIGATFICTTTGIPRWTNGTTLKQIKAQPNRLLKEQDITNARTNSFGTVITSPIVTIRDYGLDVFHDDKFEIDEVEISYIRKPAKVSLSDNINTDLPESIHSKLVGLIVAYISADLDPQSYAIKVEKSKTSEQI